jgi:hypothetical protein
MNGTRRVVRTRPHAREEDQPVVKIAAAGLVAAFVIFYIMSSPDQAAHIAKGTGHLVAHVAHGIGQFLDKLSS